MENLLTASGLVAQKGAEFFNPKRLQNLSTHKVAQTLFKKNPKQKKFAVVSYSLFGHNIRLAEILKKTIVAEGGLADIFCIPQSVYSEEELKSFGAAEAKYPFMTLSDLSNYDAFLFGFPSRFGSYNTEWSIFWETTEPLMEKNALFGKPFGTFVSSATPGGGLELTQMNLLSLFIYHGMPYVPLGSHAIIIEATKPDAENFGGTAWGCGTYTSADGTRVVSQIETNIATAQAKAFYKIVTEKF